MPVRTRSLALLSALAGMSYPALPRIAVAGECTPASGANVICAGPLDGITDVTQTLTDAGAGITVTTAPGFGIDTVVGDALHITSGAGHLIFNDQNASTIAGGGNGIWATLNAGAGNLAITTTGSVTGHTADGIFAQNNGSGALLINAATVTGASAGDGIQVTNGSVATAAGTDIRITTSGAIEAGQMGIIARNYGSGEIVITTSGPVTVTGGSTGDQWAGIFAKNGDIDQLGNVTRRGTNITVTASGDVTGFYNAVAAYNFGSGSNIVHVTGDIHGETQAGILARNGIFDAPGSGVEVSAGTFISVTAEGKVVGGVQGIRVDNVGTGYLAIRSTDSVEGITDHGIVAHNSSFGTYLTIDANDVSGATDGINAFNEGTGALTVTSRGTVKGDRYGIFLDTTQSAADLTVSGEVAGAVTAVDATGVATTVRVELQPGYGFDGIVDARNSGAPSGNRLVFGGADGEATFDLGAIAGAVPDAADAYFGFDDVFLKEDGSNFIFTGENRSGAEFGAATVTGTGLAILGENAHLAMAPATGPFLVESGGVGAIGHGSLLDGDLSVLASSAVVLSNIGPFAPVAGLYGPDDRMTVAGDYQGGGGALYLDAFMDDGSGNATDRLFVNGATSGTTWVYVANAGGPGGITGRGPADGILVVDVAGPSDGWFGLGARAYGGAFEYGLFQADGEDWYLQTTNLRDQAIAAPYVPYSLRAFGSAVTGDYFERTGTRVGWQPAGTGSPSRHGGWVRLLGAWSDASGSLLGGFNDASYSESLWALQGGFDAVLAESAADSLVASAFLHYGGISTDSTNDLTRRPAGSVGTQGFGGGAGLTWANVHGLYLDGVATYTHYDIDIDTDGAAGSTGADGWTVSAEAGQQFALSNAVTLTPQAQLTYQGISVGSFVDSAGVAMAFSGADSLEGRLGLRLGFGAAPVSPARFYLGASLLHEFLDDPVASVDGLPLGLGFDGTGYEVEVGVTFADAGSGFSAWLRGDYSAPFSSGDGIATWNATGGVALRF